MKENTSISKKSLEFLVEELLKDHPSQLMIKKLMAENNIPYNSDPIIQMSQVLSVMNSKNLVNRRKGDKEI